MPEMDERRSRFAGVLYSACARVGGIYGRGPGCSIAVNASGPQPLADQVAKKREVCRRTAVEYR